MVGEEGSHAGLGWEHQKWRALAGLGQIVLSSVASTLTCTSAPPLHKEPAASRWTLRSLKDLGVGESLMLASAVLDW